MNTPPRLPSPDTHSSHNRFLYSLIIISIFLACYHVAKNDFFVLLWGPPFCGAPVRPNMINMPKSASGGIKPVLWRMTTNASFTCKRARKTSFFAHTHTRATMFAQLHGKCMQVASLFQQSCLNSITQLPFICLP